ncbi:MAG: hypothetical protein NTV55_11360 [Planctomycetota bacterium]|nr:hypothetical protein [Planctomycetota bacterium]
MVLPVLVWCCLTGSGQVPGQVQRQPVAGEAVLALSKVVKVVFQARGPVHEAYASAGGQALANPETPGEPPAPLVELPPGPGASPTQAWIPGYWEMDAETNNWLWVTGCWREAPIGYAWLPGYWIATRGGRWRRVSGCWLRGVGDSFQVEYTTPQPSMPRMSPPPQLDLRDPRNKNLVYVPGAWDWLGTSYQWRAGRLERFSPGQVWQGPRQIWTPGGVLAVPGHLDHALAARGVAYAPALLVPEENPSAGGKTAARAAAPVEIVVEPAGVWNANAWMESSWRDKRGNYLFGDYYNPVWVKNGLATARDARRRYGDPWLQLIEEEAGLDATTLRRLTLEHNERIQGRLKPPSRLFTGKQPAEGEVSLVLPVSQLSQADPVRIACAASARQQTIRLSRLADARALAEKQHLEGKRIQLQTPPETVRQDSTP